MRELDPKIAEYWLSKAPAVRALADLPRASQARLDLARELARAGALIDFRLDVMGEHPLEFNARRIELGVFSVPALNPAGGIPLPGNDPDVQQIPVTLEWKPFVEESPSPVFLRRDTGALERAEDAEYWIRPGAAVNAGDTHREMRLIGFWRNAPAAQAEILFSCVQLGSFDKFWKPTRVEIKEG